jgi:hypothetical protein
MVLTVNKSVGMQESDKKKKNLVTHYNVDPVRA